MGDKFKVGAVCEKGEVLTAVIVEEDEADLANDYVEIRVEHVDDHPSPRQRRREENRIVRSIFVGKLDVKEEVKSEPVEEETGEDDQGNIWFELFATIDSDGDGILSSEELWRFIKSFNCPVLQAITREEFDSEVYGRCLNRESLRDKFCRDDFVEFMEEYAMRVFFADADLDGDGKVTFEEILAACLNKGIHIGYTEISAIKLLFDSEKDVLLNPEQIKEKLKESSFAPSMANMPGNEEGKAQRALGKLDRQVFRGKNSKFFINTIKFMEEESASSGKRTASKRWNGFINFQREVQGRMAMAGGDHLIKDVLPGKVRAKDLVRFSDLPALKPEYAEVTGVRWIRGEGQSGRLLFPGDSPFFGEVPVQYGTNELLSYFGVRIAESDDREVSLAFRHAIQDFTYSDNYLDDYCKLPKDKGGAGGAGCERHEFSHLDCPLKEDSGVFVFLKFVDKEETCLHISGFRIPVRHTLFIPGMVIHTNDYLKGTWRTMLSDAGPPIDHVKLHKGSHDESVGFNFTFTTH